MLESNNLLGQEQTGFRAGFSTTDNIFTLHCLINLFLNKKKRLFCAFIDFEKAFDKIDRALMWQKLLTVNINGPFMKIIKNIYSKAKSCVRINGCYSNYFYNNIGVRQGENLSPLLFSIFLNDLKSYLTTNIKGLETLSKEATDLNMSDYEIDVLFHMFLLLYADDTIICCESEKQLQLALDAMYNYCKNNKLTINVMKTKIVVFSRGKIRKKPCFLYNGHIVEVVHDIKYLGIKINYNNKFNVTVKDLYDRASKAMFSLMCKCRKLSLPIDIQIDLFDRMVLPILLYNCEIWGSGAYDLSKKLQLRFYKSILRLKKSTPDIMVYGELGKYPVDINIKWRMLNYWYRLINVCNRNKLSSIIYWFSYRLFTVNKIDSDYLTTIKNTLCELGLSGFWYNQLNLQCSEVWFKEKIKRCLYDQYIHKWFSEIDNKNIYWNYRIFKDRFSFEKYFNILSYKQAISFLRFRTLNNNIPVQTERYVNIPRADRLCPKCSINEIGDEYHYILICEYFKEHRVKLLPSFYWKRPNIVKFYDLFNSIKKTGTNQTK